ncbi:putative bifunctional diguanylate cyclase/phosphodiesterase [Granulosicoccus antarcticus]|nr:bifunctional diguanylate cyclase/phosphodiesterase [Granulosicoccus antarcticus]
MIILLVIFGTIVVNLNHQFWLSALTRKVEVAADVAVHVQLVTEEESPLGIANRENGYLARSVIQDALVDADVFFLHDSAGNSLRSVFEKGRENIAVVAAVAEIHAANGYAGESVRRDMKLIDGQSYVWSSTRVGGTDRWFTAVMKAPGHYTLSAYLLSPSFLVIILAVVWMAIWTSTYIVRKFVNKIEENSTILHYRSMHDSLTGLPNRQKLSQIILEKMAVLDTDRQRLYLLLVDLIGFRDINDTLGHDFGDQLLTRIGVYLGEIEADRVDVVRMGGDVFCLVCTEDLVKDDASRLSDAVRDKLQCSHELNGVPVAVQVRIGIASYPENSVQPEELIRFADIALAKAKSLRIRECYYRREQNTHSLRKLTLLARLKTAIEQDQLTLVYQPKVNIHNHSLVGVEALVRWNDAEYGPISPIEFVTWAEKSGLINRLTRWVLNTAEEQSRAWQVQGYMIPIAVNISPTNLSDPKLIPLIEQLVTEGSFGNSMLELEITENAMMENPEQALKSMEELCKMGLKFAIDDFGTGLSSFSYLLKMPISNLKIDRAFIMNNDENDKDAVILRSMIKLGQGLGCIVTAEGVEDQLCLERLKSLGCDCVQGFHVCRPIPADELLRWIDDSGWVAQDKAA